jgi:hypothetical protein
VIIRVKHLETTIPKYLKKLVELDTNTKLSIGQPESILLTQTVSRIYSEVQNLVRNHIKETPPPYLFDELLSRIEYLEVVILKREQP